MLWGSKDPYITVPLSEVMIETRSTQQQGLKKHDPGTGNSQWTYWNHRSSDRVPETSLFYGRQSQRHA
jgi:hypothetical protein